MALGMGTPDTAQVMFPGDPSPKFITGLSIFATAGTRNDNKKGTPLHYSRITETSF